jgi:hypothetical protein
VPGAPQESCRNVLYQERPRKVAGALCARSAPGKLQERSVPGASHERCRSVLCQERPRKVVEVIACIKAAFCGKGIRAGPVVDGGAVDGGAVDDD